MKKKTKNAIAKKMEAIEKLLADINVLLGEDDELPILTTEYDTYLVPRRVEFCEHCMDIKPQIGYADVDIEDYKKDKDCMPNITWCRSCGEDAGTGVLEE